MREIINDAEIIITTTPNYHFKGDRCYYSFTPKVNNNLKVDITIDGEIYSAVTDSGFLRMDVTDILAKVNNGDVAVIIDYTIGVGARKNVVDDLVVADGKTLPQRTHGVETHVQIPNTLKAPYPMEIFVLDECVMKNPLYQSSPNHRGIFKLGTIGKPNYNVQISYRKPHLIGTIGKVENTQYHTIQVQENCIPDNGVVVQYKNTDGCTRFAIGKIIDETTEVEAMEYSYNNSEIDSLTQRKIIGGEQSIKVAFVGVPMGQYIEDMLLSDELDVMDASFQMGFPCTITGNQKIVHGTTIDFIVTLKIVAL